ncbi:beta-glucosidase [Streptomyces sp. NPDC057002]|uniref:beta-glucosidase n=1 Tax=Streptomyces sp. NPDC057002 TaxID=3345992 RepID=UPI003624DCF0
MKTKRVLASAATALTVLGGYMLWPTSAASSDQRSRADRQVNSLVRAMSLDEKISFVHGSTDPESRGQAGFIPGVERLGIPPLRLTDGPAGIHLAQRATAMPAPVALASTFDDRLARDFGKVIGRDGRALGQDVLLSPMTNIIRVPYGGRNFETFAEDPLLSSRMVAQEIAGIQGEGLMTSVKHFAANNQERDRQTLDARVGEQALREVELPPFEAALKAGASSFMCAYNKVNGVYACENEELLNNVLREQWGFEGWVMSDWRATHSTKSLSAGLDQEMPLGQYLDAPLKKAVQDGSIPQSKLDMSVTRILTQMHHFGLLRCASPAGAREGCTLPERPAPAGTMGDRIAQQVAEQGAVLLKNERHTLPLTTRSGSLAVIGQPAQRPVIGGGGSSEVNPRTVTAPLDEIRKRATGAVAYRPGLDLTGTRIDDNALQPAFPTDGIDLGYDEEKTFTSTLTVKRGGMYTFTVGAPQSISLLTIDGTDVLRGSRNKAARGALRLKPGTHEFKLQLRSIRSTDHVSMSWVTPEAVAVDRAQAVEAARAAKTAVVFAFDEGTEGFDRTGLSLPFEQDQLIEAVTRANRNTVVVLNTGSAVTMPWLNRVKAVLNMYYPGGMGGRATARLLYGQVSPSGRLTQTFPTSEEHTSVAGDPSAYPGRDGVVTYSEGVDVGYRWYDKTGTPSLFPFGYGLSYTSFEYSRFQAKPTRDGLTVTLRVRNTGRRTGSDTPQIYLGPDSSWPGEQPTKTLAGYTKVTLEPGEETTVRIPIDRNSLRHWNADTHEWDTGRGSRTVWAGSSATRLPLHTRIPLRGPTPPRRAVGPSRSAGPHRHHRCRSCSPERGNLALLDLSASPFRVGHRDLRTSLITGMAVNTFGQPVK